MNEMFSTAIDEVVAEMGHKQEVGDGIKRWLQSLMSGEVVILDSTDTKRHVRAILNSVDLSVTKK